MKKKLGRHSHLETESISYRVLQNDWFFFFFFQSCLSGSNPDIQMSRELYFLLQSWGQASKTKTSSPCCAYNSTLSLKRFCGRQESSGKIYIYILLKQGEWQWLTGLNNARLRLRLKTKEQKSSGGNLSTIACCLRKEPGWKCHLFTHSNGFRLSRSHSGWTSWQPTCSRIVL